MIRVQFILVTLLQFCFTGFSQSLILNGGFEDVNSCLEYHMDCAPEAWLPTVPTFNYYYRDPALAHAGERCLVLVAGHERKPYYRSFARTRLCCALQPGNQYRISLWVKSRHPLLDSLGLYFSHTDFLFEQHKNKVVPQLYFSDAIRAPVNEDTNWQKVEWIYTAKGDEFFVSLGNFCKRGIAGETGKYMERNFFVLFDDISMLPVDESEKLCSDWTQRKAEIYGEDQRHEYISKLVQFYRGRPAPEPAPITATEYVAAPKPELFVLDDVLFATGSAELKQQGENKLTAFCKSLSGKRIDSIVVAGHTDSIGTAEDNLDLSLRRAGTVRTFLSNRLPLLPEQIRAYGFGATQPVTDNQTAVGRQRNRRVEIFLYFRKTAE